MYKVTSVRMEVSTWLIILKSKIWIFILKFLTVFYNCYIFKGYYWIQKGSFEYMYIQQSIKSCIWTLRYERNRHWTLWCITKLWENGYRIYLAIAIWFSKTHKDLLIKDFHFLLMSHFMSQYRIPPHLLYSGPTHLSWIFTVLASSLKQ